MESHCTCCLPRLTFLDSAGAMHIEPYANVLRVMLLKLAQVLKEDFHGAERLQKAQSQFCDYPLELYSI